jgi:MYXO-CTERM domain-containing protein
MSDRREIDVPQDPSGIEQPHDVLAAEEFALPTRSAGDIPPDPTGIHEPHDVLAAEEFAMPGAGVEHDGDAGFVDPRSLIPGLLLVVALLLLRRRRRRRRSDSGE